MKARWLDRTLFINAAYFTLCTTEKQFVRALKHFKLSKRNYPEFVAAWHSDATTHFLENRNDRKTAAIVCVANFNGKTPAQIAGLLCHEAVHIWQHTCNEYGETAPSNELEAYAIQNLTQSLIEEFERQTK